MLGPYFASEIAAYQDAIGKSGRDMVLSLSPGRVLSLAHLEHLRFNAQMWRVSDDLWDNWDDVEAQFARMARWAPHQQPGGVGGRGHAAGGQDRPPRGTRPGTPHPPYRRGAAHHDDAVVHGPRRSCWAVTSRPRRPKPWSYSPTRTFWTSSGQAATTASSSATGIWWSGRPRARRRRTGSPRCSTPGEGPWRRLCPGADARPVAAASGGVFSAVGLPAAGLPGGVLRCAVPPHGVRFYRFTGK